MKKLIFLFTYLCFLYIQSKGQTSTNRNKVWVITDSTGIDFTNSPNIVPQNNNVISGQVYGTASIADSTGNLLLYSNGRQIWGRNNLLCINNDTLLCNNCHNSSFFLPSQIDASVYYYFRTWNANTVYNLEFTKLKTDTNNICEQVSIQWKQLCGAYGARKMVPIKHGNGKDWWILSFSKENAQYCRMLFSNDSLYILGFDSLMNTFTGFAGGTHCQLDVSSIGEKIVTSYNNFDTTDVCVYNFDRCSGLISFDKRIFLNQNANQNQTDLFWLIRETVFSNDGKYVYAMTWDTLYQLNSTLDWTQQTPLVIWYDTNHVDYNDLVVLNAMERAPDGKIYISRDRSFSSTFQDSVNLYLGVIDSIDNAYPSAHFIRKGFYLGGKQARGGLVQNVNYDLGPWVGSPCDTMSSSTGLNENPTKPQLTLYPNPTQTEATLTWAGVQEGTFVLRDMLGRALVQQELNASSGSIKLNLAEFSKGIYLWQVRSKVHAQNGKLIIEK